MHPLSSPILIRYLVPCPEPRGIRRVAVNILHLQPGRRIAFGLASPGLQALPVGVVGLDGPAGIGFAVTIPAPQRRFEGQAGYFAGLFQVVGNGRDDEYGLPVGAVQAETADRVADFRIGETARDQPVVCLEKEAIPGTAMGVKTCNISALSVAPSIRAASRISPGISLK